MTLTEFMNKRYANRPDKDNIFGVGLSDAEFRTFIINYLLGENWYVVDPLGQTQINEIALYKILEKYSKQYRKECKSRKRRNNMITIRIGKKMYDVTKRCPICSEEKVILSKYSDRLICTCCENWMYVDDAVGTDWVKESEVKV